MPELACAISRVDIARGLLDIRLFFVVFGLTSISSTSVPKWADGSTSNQATSLAESRLSGAWVCTRWPVSPCLLDIFWHTLQSVAKLLRDNGRQRNCGLIFRKMLGARTCGEHCGTCRADG